MKKVFYLIISVILSLAFFACANDDDFSSEGNLRLTFSSDTISFDTIFTDMSSPTKQFKIYNRNNKSLVIESIELMNPSKSGFRMNIDGEKGTKLTNVEILKKDSLYALLEVTLDLLNSDNPLLIRDSIKFTTNGTIQYLQLAAIGQDVYIWKNRSITTDSIITNRKPILIYDSLTINKNVTATIEEGVKFYFRNNASMQVHGTIIANGSIQKPIILRGERSDNIEGNIPYNNVPGQWNGIYFYPESYNNFFDNVYVRNAVRGMTFYTSALESKKATLINTIVHNTTEYGVLSTYANIDAKNCLFTNSKGATVELHGGEYSFIHCTIANYYGWSNRTSETFIISNYADIGKATPLRKCDVANTIVYGSISKELLLDDDTSTAFNYQFTNCLLKAPIITDARFKDVIWNQSPLFKNLNNDGTFSYSFELQKNSPAINKADRSFSDLVPYDLKGNSRLSDSNPDIGCYEWTE